MSDHDEPGVEKRAIPLHLGRSVQYGPAVPGPEDVQRDIQRWLAYERTHLANERTYAAWLRTGLSVAAVGIAVGHFIPENVRAPVLSLTLGTGFVVAGVALIAFGAYRYGQTHGDLADVGAPMRLVAPRVVYVVSALVAALLLAALAFV